MDSKIFRKIKKNISLRNIGEQMWSNKRWTAFGTTVFIGVLVIVFAENGLMQRRKLERDKAIVIEKIRVAEDEQVRLREQSRALDGDKKAVEKMAREKYGMIREGEKVYKIVPPKQ